MFSKLFKKSPKSSKEAKKNIDFKDSLYSILFEIIAADHLIEDSEINLASELINEYFNIDTKLSSTYFLKLRKENYFNSDLSAITLDLKNKLDYTQRQKIIEIAWKVLLVDNNEDILETSTVRKISILLGIEDQDFISIRNRVKSFQ